MAKKKSDTKGLAGIVKNVPRELDIKGQKHMLAWITPKEGETLKALGGSGELGPMGIPAYVAGNPGGASSQAGDSDKGGFSGPENRGELGGGTDKGSSVSGGGASNDGGGKASDDKPTTVTVNGKTYSTETTPGTGSTYEEQEVDPGVVQDMALRDFLSSKGDLNWVEQRMLNKLNQANLEQYYGPNAKDKYESPFYSVPQDQLLKSPGAIKAPYALEYDPVTDQYTGYREKVNPFGMAGLISKILEIQPSAYTGFGKGSQPSEDIGGAYSHDRERISGLTSLQEKPTEEIAPVSVSPADYYSKGVGSATINLYDPTQIDAYLAQLYGQTPSPIGATYDAATRSYTMPGSSKKKRTRLRGLDIFKPVSM